MMVRDLVAWESAKWKCDHILPFLQTPAGSAQARHALVRKTPTLAFQGALPPWAAPGPAQALHSLRVSISPNTCDWPEGDIWLCCPRCLASFLTVFHLIHSHRICTLGHCSARTPHSHASLSHTGAHASCHTLPTAGPVLHMCPVEHDEPSYS